MPTQKKIPYGVTDFKLIQDENYYYVDKTAYIPLLETAGRYLFLIRPRRFGKTLFLAVLECYYDIARKGEFETLFNNTFIGTHPTPERNSHLILKFNFSKVNPDLGGVEESFNEHVENRLFFFGKKYRAFLDDDYFERMAIIRSSYGKLDFLLDYVGSKNLKVYILIDEYNAYDNFANTIMSTSKEAGYKNLTHGAGFFRFFFNILKGATSDAGAGVSRLFVTGVSPVTMDDVTSGFNIGRNISLHPTFNELLGFTEHDVADIFKCSRPRGGAHDANDVLALMKEWYGHYRFSSKAPATLFNTDMVLYFISNLMELGDYPDKMIDQNMKIDYGKLRHLVVLDKRLNGNFSRLADIVESGQITATIVESFPMEDLAEPNNFVSLLYYFGLLSYIETDKLGIPNLTIRKLMYGYLRDGYKDVNVFRVDPWRFANLIRDMAYRGEWKPVFRFLADEVKRQTSIRDYLTGEKVIQTFLLAYLNMTDYYITRTEEEMGKGFADVYLEPFLSKYPKVAFTWLVELKYVKRSDCTGERVEKQLAYAEKQLAAYAADERIVKRGEGTTLKRVALVFSGWELKAAREIH